MTMKKISVTNFDLEKAIRENWNPEKFSIGDDILSIEVIFGERLYELQLFAYWQNDDDTADYFEMNIVRKIPFYYGEKHETDYDIDGIHNYEFDIDQYRNHSKLQLIHDLTLFLLNTLSNEEFSHLDYFLEDEKSQWFSKRTLFYNKEHCGSALRNWRSEPTNTTADLVVHLMNYMEELGQAFHVLDFNNIDT